MNSIYLSILTVSALALADGPAAGASGAAPPGATRAELPSGRVRATTEPKASNKPKASNEPTASLASKAEPPEEEAAPKPGVPFFKDGEAQVVKEFEDPDYWLRHDLWVETEFDSDQDGRPDRVHVSVTRPRQTETEGLKLPVIYETSPYFAGTGESGTRYFWDPHQELGQAPKQRTTAPPVERKGMRPIISKSLAKQWTPRGYIVVHSSSPGTGLSQGCPTIGGENESLAPKAVIDWLCGRADGFTSPDGYDRVSAGWCNGKVGMTGTSFNGSLALAAASTGVQGLEAIIPIAPNTSYYHYYRSNGLVRHPLGYMGEDIDCLYEFIHSGPEALRECCDNTIRDRLYRNNMDRASGDYNDFWRGRDYLHKLEPMKCALLMAHGFNDWNVVPEHSFRIYDAVRSKGLPCQLYYHQGGHGGAPPLKQMNRWFTRYLHGVENGVEQDCPAWIVREADDPDKPTGYPAYPHPEAKPIVLRLGKGAPERGSLRLGSPGKQGVETLVDNYSFNGEALARAEWTRHRLIYTAPELKRPVHISGTPRIKLRLACDRDAANLSVWLVSLPWNTKSDAKITDNIITRGWADPQNYRSITEGEPLRPGRFYDLEFDLQPDDQVVPAGQQIGLMIFSSDQDFTLWPKPGAELTVDLDATRLSLPVVGGKKGWRKAFTEEEEPTKPAAPPKP
ncbi:Xaa-Pro dipeptidyl-peptidase [Pirellulimonas nuda]|uniref:Xaa-Pro dipeptidyl-peptidase n=1 Tax=Pirellulimonas nuda TaxID=2528009 RepID=A0A518DIA1_9BACT|nr:Xaa-Pro dipeptidyl-peptidase [Pirellulimonas nuda]QDU91213.1 Xaa-Pro dipeptidyl-peptidase [Pirellulimonas nuda]